MLFEGYYNMEVVMNIKKILFFTLTIFLTGRFAIAWDSQQKIPTAQAIEPKKVLENPEQTIEKLAHSLGLTFKKKCIKSGKVEFFLESMSGIKSAYLIGCLHEAYLEYLEVNDTVLRNHKIGSLLFETFRYECSKQGHTKMRWMASSFGRHKIPHDQLIAFYKKLGGRIVSGDNITYNCMECDTMLSPKLDVKATPVNSLCWRFVC
jgi:hypothetical protein